MDKKRDRGVALTISVLLHGLLALLPWQESWQKKSLPVAVSPAPASQISVVDASQLPTLPASKPQPLPSEPSGLPPASAVPPPLPADLTPDVPISEASNRPINEPALEAASDTDTVPTTTSSAGASTPNSNLIPTDDEAQIAADWENLLSHFEAQDKGFGFALSEIFDFFGESGPANQFFDENNHPKFDVSSFYHFPEQTPEQIFQDVVMPKLNSNTSFAPQAQENFRAGLAYQISQGEKFRYLIIVRLREGEGSVLVLSESLPGLES